MIQLFRFHTIPHNNPRRKNTDNCHLPINLYDLRCILRYQHPTYNSDTRCEIIFNIYENPVATIYGEHTVYIIKYINGINVGRTFERETMFMIFSSQNFRGVFTGGGWKRVIHPSPTLKYFFTFFIGFSIDGLSALAAHTDVPIIIILSSTKWQKSSTVIVRRLFII